MLRIMTIGVSDRYNDTILITSLFTHRPNSIVESNTDSKLKLAITQLVLEKCFTSGSKLKRGTSVGIVGLC